MLISSRTLRGKCPVCGAENCSCGGPSTVAPVDERIKEAKVGGRLVSVPTGRPGVSVKVTEEEARRLGHLPAEPAPKARPPVPNKKRRPAENK
jgi:hypothetical protein